MRFWESSAIVPLLSEESRTASLAALLRSDRGVTVWWGAEVECVSALRRRERDGTLAEADIGQRFKRLREWKDRWQEVQPAGDLRDIAVRLLAMHALRAGDALQLAAAIVACEGRPSSLPFVSLDRRLAIAAAREGLEVVPVE